MGEGDARRARSFWRKAARGAGESARPLVDPAVLDPRGPPRNLALGDTDPEAAVLILLGLAGRRGFAGKQIEGLLKDLVADNPALGPAVACALLMEPELLCAPSARCLFALLEERLPAFAGMYGAGKPEEFSRESLDALIGELGAASGGPPRWRCSICGHQDETHSWRCNECGAWESARLISVLAP